VHCFAPKSQLVVVEDQAARQKEVVSAVLVQYFKAEAHTEQQQGFDPR
jgi:hypothetical protein